MSMETIKRYGVKMGDLGGDNSLKSSTAVAGRGVPKKFIETPGRIWMKNMVRVVGLFSFVLTALTVSFCFLGGFIPGVDMNIIGEAMPGMITGLLFINHMGLFIEMAGDAGGKNWFARGAGLMWFSLFGMFLFAIAARIWTSMF